MAELQGVLGNATLLDLSLPGTHDSMTYDLSDALSDGYEGMGPVVSGILHALTPAVGGRFIRQQGQTQGISVREMLDGGIRFIDFRIMYTREAGHMAGEKDWYCLHGCQTRRKALDYLKEVRAWLDEHPKELVVMWASRHGTPSLNGTEQFPGTTPHERQAFFDQVAQIFQGLLFNSSQKLNETTFASLQQRNQRLLWFATDYEESTRSSDQAVNAMAIDNELMNVHYGVGNMEFLRKAGAKLAETRKENRFLLMSMAARQPRVAVEDAAKITFLPDVFRSHEKYKKECAESAKIPNMTSCPMALMDWSLLMNYYNQRVLDLAYSEGATNLNTDFPNAIYLDAVDVSGLIRTGTSKINPLLQEHATDGYAYAATLIAANVRRLCRGRNDCLSLQKSIEDERAQHPLSLWDDPNHGRLMSWPSLEASPVMLV